MAAIATMAVFAGSALQAQQGHGGIAGGACPCRVAKACGDQSRLELCLHDGGHLADAAWSERA
jgi:polyhydroxybutyrate depolymerase